MRTTKTRALVEGLKSHSKYTTSVVEDIDEALNYISKYEYHFHVMAFNTTVTGLAGSSRCKTAPSTAAQTAFAIEAGIVGSLLLPYVIDKARSAFNDEESEDSDDDLEVIVAKTYYDAD